MKLKLERPVIVEGKYDKIKLSNIVDGLVICVNGFSVFKDEATQNLIRTLAEKTGIIILTDSDSAGFMIRRFVSDIAGKENVFQAYIPDVYGKERRKIAPSGEGKLGVEGIDDEVIIEALKRAEIVPKPSSEEKLTRARLYELGLTGGENSAKKRKRILKRLSFPENMNTTALVDTVNRLMTLEEFERIINDENSEESDEDRPWI